MTPEKRRELLSGPNEPKINVLDYQGSLAKALNYYNVEADSKKKRKYAETYAKKNLGIDVSSAPDYLLNTIGAMCRLIDRNEPISDFDIARTNEGLSSIASGKIVVKSSVTEKINEAAANAKPKKTAEQIAEDLASPIIEDIEYAIDDLILKEAAGGSDFNTKSFSIKNAKAAKIVTEYVEQRLSSFEEVRDSSDSQIKEAYAHISKRKFNHLVTLFNDILTRIKQSVATSKVTKKPRTKKEKPAYILVNKMKYKKDSPELNIVSLDPKDIIGATEVVVFNTKYRRISVIRALAGNTLSVKGTTIVNFDPTTTICKTLRKPEEQLKLFYKSSKRNVKVAFDAVKSVDRLANTRMSEDMLIVSINK